MKTKILRLLILIALMLPVRLLGDSINVYITVDNGYAFGFGNVNGINAAQFYGGIDNCYPQSVFGPTCYVFVPPDNPGTDPGPEIYNLNVDNPADVYIYIVAWSDDGGYQGTVASFTDPNTGVTVTTSPSWPWQVFATGTNITPNCSGSGSHGPTLAAINSEIAMANASAGPPGSSSVGWVGNNGWVGGVSYAPGSLDNGRLDFSDQFNGNRYPVAVPSCIGSNALWMEYNPEPTNATCNPFIWGSTEDYNTTPNFLREYLIYRIGPLGSIISSTNTCTNACLVLDCPNDIVVTSSVPIPVYYSPSATTCCSNGTLSVVCSPVSGSTNDPNTTTTVSCTATDSCSNSCTCSFTVRVVVPMTAPGLYCTNQTIPCSSPVPTNPPSYYDPSCSNASVTLSGSWTNSNGNGYDPYCSTQYVYQVWQLEDSCSNNLVCTQMVTVLPATLTLTCTNMSIVCGSLLPTNGYTVSQSCAASLTVSQGGSWTNSFDCCSTGTIYQLWSAHDYWCTNLSTVCTQTVTVLPNTIPYPSNITVYSCSDVPVFYTNFIPSSVSCTNKVVFDPPSGTSFAHQTVSPVNWSVYDCSGTNICSSGSFWVFVFCTNCCPCINYTNSTCTNYTVTVFPGSNYLADVLCQGTNNTLADVLPSVSNGTEVCFWNQWTETFTPPDSFNSQWQNGTEPLVPGEGFLLVSTNQYTYTLTIYGCEPTCPGLCAPLDCSSGTMLVGGYGLTPLAFSNMFCMPMTYQTEVLAWNPTNQVFTTYTCGGTSWSPPSGPPLLQPGYSEFVEVQPCPTNLPSYQSWANQYFACTNCAIADPDADPFGKGMSNTNQFLAGFNPTNAAAYLHIISIAKTNGTDISVTYLGANGDTNYVPGIASRTNILEYSTGAANGGYTNNFLPVPSGGATNILSGGIGLGAVTNIVDPGGATNRPSRYYRVRVLLP
ncbi:MAG: hypothetical protein ABSA12_10460 [Verrucomicrobiia bacterium]